MFAEAFEDLLQGHCTAAHVRSIEAGQSHETLWTAIVDSGFLDVMSSEEHGGAGLDLADVLPMFQALGAHAVPLPVGEAMVLRALLPGQEMIPSGLPAIAPALSRTAEGGLRASQVPFGAIADVVVGEFEGELWILDASAGDRQMAGIHKDMDADLYWSKTSLEKSILRVIGLEKPGAVSAWGAALQAALLSGALTKSFELTLRFGNDRVQFGKSIGKFQAIQHQLAVMAEHVAAARMAVALAFPAGSSQPCKLPSAVAKARASEAVTLVAPIAHAVHGAIGVTEEYDLQLFTRRLRAWRWAHGSEAYWHRVVGDALLSSSHSVGDFAADIYTNS